MRERQLAGIVAAVLGAALLTGCSAAGDAPEPTTPSPDEATQDEAAQDEAAQDEMAQDEMAQDQDTCAAFGDVLTILENADLGVRDGRMETQEQQGWYQLATRVLDRLPERGEGPVSQAITDLRDVAPAIPPGSGFYAEDIRSPEWSSAFGDLHDACLEVDAVLEIQAFTGG